MEARREGDRDNRCASFKGPGRLTRVEGAFNSHARMHFRAVVTSLPHKFGDNSRRERSEPTGAPAGSFKFRKPPQAGKMGGRLSVAMERKTCPVFNLRFEVLEKA
jgi:hypothetical protein